MPVNPMNKFTLGDWIKHPTTIMLIVFMNIAWVLIFIIVNMGKESGEDRIEDLKNQLKYSDVQLKYCQERNEVLEKQIDRYTTAILFKDGQILVRDNVIDSLKKEKQ